MIPQARDQIVITETLGSDSHSERLISDSALKVVSSYYPVCRCQRTSRFRTFEATKKLNLDRYGPAFAEATAGKAGQN
jgi:hypothetical protein